MRRCFGLNNHLSLVSQMSYVGMWTLDRFGRSLKDLIALVEELEKCKIGLRSLQETIDTTSGGKLVFHMFGALAEFERNLIREHTQAGLKAARTRGRTGGRRQKLTPQQIGNEPFLSNHFEVGADAKQVNLEPYQPSQRESVSKTPE